MATKDDELETFIEGMPKTAAAEDRISDAECAALFGVKNSGPKVKVGPDGLPVWPSFAEGDPEKEPEKSKFPF